MKHISQRFVGLVVAASVLAEVVAPVSATYAFGLPGAPITAPHPGTTINTGASIHPAVVVGLIADQQAQQAIDQFATNNAWLGNKVGALETGPNGGYAQTFDMVPAALPRVAGLGFNVAQSGNHLAVASTTTQAAPPSNPAPGAKTAHTDVTGTGVVIAQPCARVDDPCATVFYTSQVGAHAVHGPIRVKYLDMGGASSPLGYPVGDQGKTPDGLGQFNYFQHGSIYWTQATGAHDVLGPIQDKWSALRWETGPLGYPIIDESTTPDRIGRYVHFQKGSIYWTQGTGAHDVLGPIRDAWTAQGWEKGPLGYPTSDQGNAPDGVGLYNHFQNGSIYFSSSTGAHSVLGAIRDKWAALGYEQSYLAYPSTDEFDCSGGRCSTFQNGTILRSTTDGTVQDQPEMLAYDTDITFSDDTPVGGHGTFALYSDGTVHFSGHMHDSGFPSYKYSVVMGTYACIKCDGSDTDTFEAPNQGSMAGTVDSGSRDDFWDKSAVRDEVRQHWSEIRSGSSSMGYYWKVSSNSDWLALVNSVAGEVAKIYKLFEGSGSGSGSGSGG